MAGRRPTPTALKKLAGNPGHRPLNDLEPQPERTAPEKPKGMVPAASREWDFIVVALQQLGLITNVDGKALAAYCDAYGLWEEARREIKKYGLVFKTPKLDKLGDMIIIRCADDDKDWEMVNKETGEKGKYIYEFKANPAVQIYNTFGKLMKSYLIEFGLTPASRTKLKIQPKKEADAGDEFMGRKKATPPDVNAAKQAAPLAFDTGKAVPIPGKPDFANRISDADTNFDA